MSPSWRDIAKAMGFILLFAVMGYNLYQENGILTSIFRGVVVFLVFNIISIILSNIIVKLLNDFEIKRLQDIQTEAEQEEVEFPEEFVEEGEVTE